jgi:hypothetical protein
MRTFDDRRDQRPAVNRERDEEELVHAVRRALSHLRDPRRPAGGPLLTVPGLGSVQAITAFVRTQVETLARSASPMDQEAAQILGLYYLCRTGGHDVTAHRVHLSRATYFRRLDHGIRHLAEAIRTLTVIES